jgi:hypothetical protein
LYIVANQGASPSGRLTAALDVSMSEERPGGFWSGEILLEPDGTRGLCVLDVFRGPAGVTLRVPLGGLVVLIVEALVPGLAIVGEVVPVDFMPDLELFADKGASLLNSVSSSKFWLAALLPLVRSLGLA